MQRGKTIFLSRTTKVWLVLFMVFGGLAACHPELPESSTKNMPKPEGATVFTQMCDKCHTLERALTTSGDEETWQITIQRMRDKCGARFPNIDVENAVAYHLDRQKHAGKVFQDDCQLCHAGKNSSKKSLNREQVHALVKKKQQDAGSAISDADAELIVNYHIREHRVALDNNVRGGLGLEKENLESWQMIGRTLFLEKCSSCHALQRAVGSIKDERAWAVSMKRMQDYSKGKISTQEINSLVAYHVKEQRRELEVFQETCTQCHTEERFTSHSMSDEETLRMLRKMQRLAPDMITDDKVQVLFLFHQRQEKTFAGLFEGRCRRCHKFKAQESLTTAATTQDLGMLVSRARNFFGGVLKAPDVSNLLTFHREREGREMVVFKNSCDTCHDQAMKKQQQLESERLLQISTLQGRELDRDVKETIKTQIRFHVLEQSGA